MRETSVVEPATHWEESGWGLRVESVDELLRLVTRIPLTRAVGHRIVWRGVPCASWRIESSLQRAIQTEPSYYGAARSENGPDALRQAERSLITLARDWGIGANNGAFHTDLQVLATLQHHGVPTRLIDVSTDPITALWFASAFPASNREGDSQDAALFAFSTCAADEQPTMDIPRSSWGELEDRLGCGLRQVLAESRQRPTLLRPSFPDARMAAQSGRFLIGQPWDDETVQTFGWSPVPGITAFTYDATGSTPAAAQMRLLIDRPPLTAHCTSSDSVNKESEKMQPTVPFGAIIIPRALVGQVRNNVLDQHDKTYRALMPDEAGLATAIDRQAVPLPRWQRNTGQSLTDELADDQRRRAEREQTMYGLGGW